MFSRLKRVVVVSELSHVADLKPYLTDSTTILALDREVEYALEEQGIPFISAKDYRGTKQFDRIIAAERFVQELFSKSEWSFFTYRNIPLGTVFTFVLQEYLDFFLYYLEIFSSLADRHPDSEWVVLPPSHPPPRSGGALAAHMHRAVQDAASLTASQHGIRYTAPSASYRPEQARLARGVFALKRVLSGLLLTVFTKAVSFRAHQKPIRILVSDHWRNVGTLVEKLPEAGMTFLDRKEATEIPLGLIRSRRMQFLRLDAQADRKAQVQLREAERFIREAWAGTSLSSIRYKSIDITPILQSALDTILTEALHPVLRQVEGAYKLLKNMDAVLLRVSVGGQTHFSVLALVARQLDVPAIELQHGLEYLGPGSLSNTHTAQYIATYGPIINREFESIGYKSARLIAVGSPRFDAYQRIDRDADGAILCIGPDIYAAAGFDSYDAERYFDIVFQAIPVRERIVVKLRGHVREVFFRAAIDRVRGEHEPIIETETPLTQILAGCKFVTSCYSTAVLESLQYGIPVALVVVGELDHATITHFESYIEQNAITVVRGPEELERMLTELAIKQAYKTQSKNISTFMSRSFSFDGRATERLAGVVRRLIQNKRNRI